MCFWNAIDAGIRPPQDLAQVRGGEEGDPIWLSKAGTGARVQGLAYIR